MRCFPPSDMPRTALLLVACGSLLAGPAVRGHDRGSIAASAAIASCAVPRVGPAPPDSPPLDSTTPAERLVAAPLTISLAGLELIKRFEGFSPSPHWDRTQWSIGYGA